VGWQLRAVEARFAGLKKEQADAEKRKADLQAQVRLHPSLRISSILVF
jgi:hypothetical protein